MRQNFLDSSRNPKALFLHLYNIYDIVNSYVLHTVSIYMQILSHLGRLVFGSIFIPQPAQRKFCFSRAIFTVLSAKILLNMICFLGGAQNSLPRLRMLLELSSGETAQLSGKTIILTKSHRNHRALQFFFFC